MLFAAVGAFALMGSACSRAPEPARPAQTIGIENYAGVRDWYAFAETQRVKHGLPALAVGVVRGGRIIGLGVAGAAKANSAAGATVEHRFDIGSCSKSFTATTIALLVERGVIRWDTTLGGVFPELTDAMHPDYRTVTLVMLLQHRAGLEQTMNRDAKWRAWHRDHADLSATGQRLRLVAEVVRAAPRSTPGTEEYYTNDAYLLAAAMVERVGGRPWESWVRELVLQPLDLATVTPGPAEEVAGVSMMWGHRTGSWGRTIPIAPEAHAYGDPPFGSPGGFLHCTLPDLLRWVGFHCATARGTDTLLAPASFAPLYSITGDAGFGLGWEVEVTRDRHGSVVERSIHHGGNSAGFRANMWFCPESNTGTVILYNHGGGKHTDDYVAIFYALLRELESLPPEPA